MSRWVVVVWVEGATRPLATRDFFGADAEAVAKRIGATHRVRASEVLVQP